MGLNFVGCLKCRVSALFLKFVSLAMDPVFHPIYPLKWHRVVIRTAVQKFGATAVHESVEAADQKCGSKNVWQYRSSLKMLITTCLQRFYLKRCHSSFELLVIVKVDTCQQL